MAGRRRRVLRGTAVWWCSRRKSWIARSPSSRSRFHGPHYRPLPPPRKPTRPASPREPARSAPGTLPLRVCLCPWCREIRRRGQHGREDGERVGKRGGEGRGEKGRTRARSRECVRGERAMMGREEEGRITHTNGIRLASGARIATLTIALVCGSPGSSCPRPHSSRSVIGLPPFGARYVEDGITCVRVYPIWCEGEVHPHRRKTVPYWHAHEIRVDVRDTRRSRIVLPFDALPPLPSPRENIPPSWPGYAANELVAGRRRSGEVSQDWSLSSSISCLSLPPLILHYRYK